MFDYIWVTKDFEMFGRRAGLDYGGGIGGVFLGKGRCIEDVHAYVRLYSNKMSLPFGVKYSDDMIVETVFAKIIVTT